MKIKNLKSTDKTMYILAVIVEIITIMVISYIIVLNIMNLFNTQEYSKILINANIYSTFYKILKAVNLTIIPVIVFILIIAIPYLIISITVFVFFIRRYIRYKDKKLNKLLIILTTFILSIFSLIMGTINYPIFGRYEIIVNSKMSEISNAEVKDFIIEKMGKRSGNEYSTKSIEKDYYIYNVIINDSFPNDYDGVIYYKDGIRKEKKISLNNTDFVRANTQNRTTEFVVRATFLLIIGDILFIVFTVFIQRDLKLIAKKKV